MGHFKTRFLNINLNKSGFYLAFFALFAELVIKSILIYQESYWGWNESINQFIFRYIVKVPIFSLLLLIFLFDNRAKILTNVVSILIILLVVLLSIKIFNHWNDITLIDFNIDNIHLIGDYGYYFLIGYFIASDDSLFDRMKPLILAGTIILSLQTIVFFDLSSFSINIKNLSHNNYIHLLLGNGYALWSIVMLSVLRDKQRIIFYFLSVPFVFFMSSRSAFYCYIILLPLILYTFGKQYLKYLILFVALCIFVLILNPFHLLENRMFAIFSAHDLSLNYRMAIIKTTMPDLFKHFFTGDYGGYYKYSFPANTYVHNILSFWSQFGLLPFIIIIALVVKIISDARKQFRTLWQSTSTMTVLFTVFILFAMITAKSYAYAEFFMLSGIAFFHQTVKGEEVTDPIHLKRLL